MFILIIYCNNWIFKFIKIEKTIKLTEAEQI